MRKVALVFVVAVIVPSLVLAWLAVRSLRDQQFLIERQQSLLYQGVADSLAKEVQTALGDDLRAFVAEVSTLLRTNSQPAKTREFDLVLHERWPLAQVGFVVTSRGELLSPSSASRPEARAFLQENSRFLGNRELAEVYSSQTTLANSLNNSVQLDPKDSSLDNNLQRLGNSKNPVQRSVVPQKGQYAAPQKPTGYQQQLLRNNDVSSPNQQAAPVQNTSFDEQQLTFSKLAPSEAEFRQVIGEQTEGILARFVENKLSVLLWCRRPADSNVYGAQVDLARLKSSLAGTFKVSDPALRDELCVALVDDNARPALISAPGFQANWRRPFVATEIGEALPHWEAAVYLLHPDRLARSAEVVKLTLGLLIAVLLLAIGIGSWLIVSDLNRQLLLARQKTDFVSNVSHELKTPLTSIRMFSELLAEGRIDDPAKQRSYLAIIAAETARLTRLINNVLDFTRSERGEKKYRFQECDIVQLTKEIAETCRPPLESSGFMFECVLPPEPVRVRGDRDALAQVLLNLLSNAEKYAGSNKEIKLRVASHQSPLAHVEVQVLDRGLGVPAGCEEKIFEKFYRAHDSLSSGIQGSGLGLTLARQIARTHGGDIVYARREDGGSCFSLRLPLVPGSPATSS